MCTKRTGWCLVILPPKHVFQCTGLETICIMAFVPHPFSGIHHCRHVRPWSCGECRQAWQVWTHQFKGSGASHGQQGSAVADNPTRHIMANVLQTNNVDAQCDKLANKLSWQCCASKVANLQLPNLYLTFPTCIWCLSWGRPRLSFVEIFGTRKLEFLGYRVALFAWPYI